MRRRLLGSSAALAACVSSLVLAAPAYAEDEITIDHVASAEGTVSVLLAVDGLPPGSVVDPGSVGVTVDGETVQAAATPVEAGEIQRTTILALDASNSMRGKRFSAAQSAAKAFLAAAPADVEIGLLTFAGQVQETIAPTTDHDLLAAAVDSIDLSSGTGVYDAMVQSVNLAGTEGARSVLVLSDGADTGSAASIDDVVSTARDASVIVDVVSLDQSPKHEARLAQISETSGGKVIDADPTALADVFAAQADALAGQLLVKFAAPDTADGDSSIDVSLDVAGTIYTDSVFVALDIAPDEPQVIDLGEPLVGRPVMLLGALALGLGMAGLLSVVLVGSHGPSASQRRIDSYLNAGQPSSARAQTTDQSSVKDSAVAMAERMVTGDFETRVSQKLAGAGSSLTAAEWLLLHAGVAVAAAFTGLILGGGTLMVVLLAVGLAVPWLYLRLRHSRRLSAFNAQMPETLGLMAGGLQAGLSLPQAVDTVIREGHEPMAGELRRALMEQRLGVAVEEALDGVAARMDSEDFGWVVMAIRIQREVGGNLAEILNTVADTLRQREYLRRQVKSLSAEGRLSGYILTGLPPLIFVYMLFANPDYVRVLYTTLPGVVLLIVAGGLLAVGGFAMSRLAKVEI